jgi:hypothetical protein
LLANRARRLDAAVTTDQYFYQVAQPEENQNLVGSTDHHGSFSGQPLLHETAVEMERIETVLYVEQFPYQCTRPIPAFRPPVSKS